MLKGKVMKVLKMIFLFAPMIFWSCRSFEVVSHYNENTDFSAYQSFWVVNALKKKGAPEDSYAGLEEVERAIKNEMGKRGYSLSENPDLFVTYRIILDPDLNYRVNNYYYPYYNPYYRTPAYGYVRRGKYNEGIMFIEMRDSKTNKVVWQGSLDLRVNRKNKSSDVVAESVAMIFDEFPFVAGQKEPVLGKTDSFD